MRRRAFRGLMCFAILFGAMPAFQNNLPKVLVGDVVPAGQDLNGDGDTVDAGEFGDGVVNTLDLLTVLRAVTNIPGCVPPPSSDLFDAMDAFPVDVPGNPGRRGGDGLLNTLDLLKVLNYATGTATAPYRVCRFPFGPSSGLLPGSARLWASRPKGKRDSASRDDAPGSHRRPKRFG